MSSEARLEYLWKNRAVQLPTMQTLDTQSMPGTK